MYQRLVCMGMKPGVGHLPPSLAIYEFDESWKVVRQQLHHIPGLNYTHDFLLLPDYYVFHITPFASMPWTAVLKVYMGYSSPGQEMRYHPNMPSQFVIIPRHEGAKHQRVILVNTEPFHVCVCVGVWVCVCVCVCVWKLYEYLLFKLNLPL